MFFARAKVLLEAEEGRTMQDPSSTLNYYEHDDYAVYEQAVYMLIHVQRQRESGVMVSVDVPTRDDDKNRPVIAPMARHFLRHNMIKLERGG
jgi:hypothetical protein